MKKRDGGFIDSVRRFTDNDYHKLLDSGLFRASGGGGVFSIIEVEGTRFLGRYNAYKESLYILGKKDLTNPLVKWLSENSFVSNDEFFKLEDGGVADGFVDLSGVKVSGITTRSTSAFGNPDKLYLIYDGKTIASFYYNMRGYNQNFFLKNKDGVGFGFGKDKSETKQISDFKKALKSGYVFIKPYDKFGEGGSTKPFDTIVSVLENYGYVEKRGAYGIRNFYNKDKDSYASYDTLLKTISVDDIELPFSVRGLIAQLKMLGLTPKENTRYFNISANGEEFGDGGSVVGGFNLVYETWSPEMGGNGVDGTIRTSPENYFVAVIDRDGSIYFDDKEDAMVKGIDKDEVKRLWEAGKIKKKKHSYEKGGKVFNKLDFKKELMNGKSHYEKGDEGMYEGAEVRVLAYRGNDYAIVELDSEGEISPLEEIKYVPLKKFESSFAYIENKLRSGGEIDLNTEVHDDIKKLESFGYSVESRPLGGWDVEKNHESIVLHDTDIAEFTHNAEISDAVNKLNKLGYTFDMRLFGGWKVKRGSEEMKLSDKELVDFSKSRFKDGGSVGGRYVIQVGSKRSDGFNMGQLPYRYEWVGGDVKGADEFGRIRIVVPQKMFPTSNSRWVVFNSVDEAKGSIDNWIEHISNDDRFDEETKGKLIKYADGLKNKIVKVYESGGSVGDVNKTAKVLIISSVNPLSSQLHKLTGRFLNEGFTELTKGIEPMVFVDDKTRDIYVTFTKRYFDQVDEHVIKDDLKYVQFFLDNKVKDFVWVDSGKVQPIYEEGGNVEEVDLFEHYEDLPENVQQVLDKYSDADDDYRNLDAMEEELKYLGYTFDWGLDAVPSNLRKVHKEGGSIRKLPSKNTPEWHQLQIAKKTINMNPAMVGVMGGMSIQEAKDILDKYKIKYNNGGNVDDKYELEYYVKGKMRGVSSPMSYLEAKEKAIYKYKSKKSDVVGANNKPLPYSEIKVVNSKTNAVKFIIPSLNRDLSINKDGKEYKRGGAVDDNELGEVLDLASQRDSAIKMGDDFLSKQIQKEIDSKLDGLNFSQPSKISQENQIANILQNGEISKSTLEGILGRKLDGWDDDVVYVGMLKLQKCFLRSYYKI